jgi:hypothetical protein
MIALPSMLFGTEAAVDENAADAVRMLDSGMTLDTVVAADLRSEALVLLQGGSPIMRDVEAHRVFAIHARLDPTRPDAEPLLASTLQTEWGVLALLGQDTQRWLFPEERHQPFLAAVVQHAPALTELDGLYTIGLTSGTALWDLPTNLKYVLAQVGAPPKDLIAPLSASEWPEFVRSYL